MKIVLVITNTKRKSLVFISSELDTYSLEEAVQLTHKGKIEGVHTVQRDKNIYLRTNPKDPKLPFKQLNRAARTHLYSYLIQPKHNIFFAAANIRSIINFWAAKTDLAKRPEIIATLYSQGLGEPKIDPKPNSRGEQIAGEFYDLANAVFK